jgi:3-oxoacyl-[acyl-carrier protein] reductase
MDGSPLAGKRALVCGSTQGIGRACAVEFARLGARVTLLARNAAALETVRGSLHGAGHAVAVADFSDPDQVRRAAEEALGAAGVFHVLLNNTGGPPGGPILDATPDEFLRAFRSHLVNNHLLVQTVVPGMKEAGYGRILNVISTSVKQPIPGLGVSNTIRGAVASWAKTLAGELGPFGITVNNLLPGFTRTGRLDSLKRERARRAGVTEEEILAGWEAEIPAGRLGEPGELAAVAGFLVSPAASYVNGVSIPVDGGRTSSL